MTSKYPVPDLALALTAQWSDRLALHFGVDLDQFLAAPLRYIAFANQTVSVALMDGSSATFRWSFPLVDEERKTIAVFTEHCGHHIFPFHDAQVRIDGRLVFKHSSEV